MNEKTLQELLEAIHTPSVTIDMIPDIDLYMDQLITFFDRYLSSTKRRDDDKLLTKTMINNYTKHKLLMPANKKKYSQSHILLMLLIYQLKQVTTMDDIKTLFSSLNRDGDWPDSNNLQILYQNYLNSADAEYPDFETNVLKLSQQANEKAASSDSEEAASQLLCLLLFKQSLDYKRLAEKLLDTIL